jgi:gamma-glutamyl hydrolase
LFWLPAGCSVNGVVWTGGLVDFNPTADDPEGSKYLATTQAILEYVLARNEGGTYYPFWATCLGFERLTQLLARDVNSTIIDKVDAENLDINLNLTPSGWLSRMFGGMSYELFKEVSPPPQQARRRAHVF